MVKNDAASPPKPQSALLNHIPSLPSFIGLFSNKLKKLFTLIKSLLCARHSPECLNLFNPSVQPCEALLPSQYIVEKIMALKWLAQGQVMTQRLNTDNLAVASS